MADEHISIRMDPYLLRDLEKTWKASGMRSRSNFIQCAVRKAVQNPKQILQAKMKELALQCVYYRDLITEIEKEEQKTLEKAKLEKVI